MGLLAGRRSADCHKSFIETRKGDLGKEEILRSIRAVHGVGRYRAGRLWYFLRGSWRYPVKYNHVFAETGPGARRGLNLMHGFPLRVSTERQDASTAWQCSALLARMKALVERNAFLRETPRDPRSLQRAKEVVRKPLVNPEGRSHALCEYAKTVAHLRQA